MEDWGKSAASGLKLGAKDKHLKVECDASNNRNSTDMNCIICQLNFIFVQIYLVIKCTN